MAENTSPDSTVHVDKDEEKHQFNTSIRKSVLELLRAASFHEGEPISSIVERAITKELDKMQKEREEGYEIFPPHKIE